MPSTLHEALLLLLRNRPALAPDLLRGALQRELPDYSDVRIESADLTEIQPTEYRADLVLLLHSSQDPVLGIVVEVQLTRDERKRFSWPVYVSTLRARIKCPVVLLVIAGDAAIARWAVQPIHIGGDHRFVPWVLGFEGIPVVTDPQQAHQAPELAVLSVIAHGEDGDVARSVQIAVAAELASVGLDVDRRKQYLDFIMTSLSQAARQELQIMDPGTYERLSGFAKYWLAQGETSGRAAMVLRLLTVRFGTPGEEAQAVIARSSVAELDAIGERLLTAKSVQEALSSH